MIQLIESENRRNINLLDEDALKLESFNCYANQNLFYNL